jgi:hypothetical protein
MMTIAIDDQAELSDEEIDIVEYISGFLLRRLQKFSFSVEFRVQDKEKQSERLTGLLDRGGLLYPSHQFLGMVKAMELVFRQLPASGGKSTFVESLDAKQIPQLLKKSLKTEVPQEELESFYCELVELFYKVRMHHMCQHLLSKVAPHKGKKVRH